MEVSKLDIIRSIVNEQSAKILRARDLTPFSVQKFELDLTNARSETNPFVIGFPFKTLWVKNGSTNSTTIKVKFNKNDSSIQLVELNSNDIISSDEMFAQCFISWDAQSNETIEVYAFVSAEIKTGSLINSGSVSLSPASAISVPARVVADNTGTIFIPANGSAKKVIIENKSTTTDIMFGGSGTTNSGAATDGITLPFGQSITLDCTANIYVVTSSGTANVHYVYLS